MAQTENGLDGNVKHTVSEQGCDVCACTMYQIWATPYSTLVLCRDMFLEAVHGRSDSGLVLVLSVKTSGSPFICYSSFLMQVVLHFSAP